MEIIQKLEELFEHMTAKSFSLLMMDNLVKFGNELQDCFVFPMDLYKKAVNCLIIAKQEVDFRIFRYYLPVFKMVFLKSADLEAAMQFIYDHEHFKNTTEKIPALRDQYPANNFDKESNALIKKTLNANLINDNRQLDILARELSFYLTIAPKPTINLLIQNAIFANSQIVLDVAVKILKRLPAFFQLRVPHVYYPQNNELIIIAAFRHLICTALRGSSKLVEIRYLATELTCTRFTGKNNLEEKTPAFDPNELVSDLIVDLLERLNDKGINVLLEMLHTMLPFTDGQQKFWRFQWKKSDTANPFETGIVDPQKMQNALYDLFKREMPFKPTKSVMRAYKELYNRLKKDEFHMTDYEEDISVSFIREEEEKERAEQEEKERIEREERKKIEQAEREERERIEKERIEREEKKRAERERIEKEHIEREEKKRAERERIEKERIEGEQREEHERMKREQEAASERKRLEQEMAERQRFEKEIAQKKQIGEEFEKKKLMEQIKHEQEVAKIQCSKVAAEKKYGSQDIFLGENEEEASDKDTTLDISKDGAANISTRILSTAGSESNIAEEANKMKLAKKKKPRDGKGKKKNKPQIEPTVFLDLASTDVVDGNKAKSIEIAKDSDEIGSNMVIDEQKVVDNAAYNEGAKENVVVDGWAKTEQIPLPIYGQNLEMEGVLVMDEHISAVSDIDVNKLAIEQEKENVKASSETVYALVSQIEIQDDEEDSISVKSSLDPNAPKFHPQPSFRLSPSNQQVSNFGSSFGQRSRSGPASGIRRPYDYNTSYNYRPPYYQNQRQQSDENFVSKEHIDRDRQPYQQRRNYPDRPRSQNQNYNRPQALMDLGHNQSKRDDASTGSYHPNWRNQNIQSRGWRGRSRGGGPYMDRQQIGNPDGNYQRNVHAGSGQQSADGAAEI